MFTQHSKQLSFLILACLVLFSTQAALGKPSAAEPFSVDVALGETGVSFAYERTLGHPGEPYPADAAHLYGPNGLGVDAAGNIYVAEQASGQRMLVFNPATLQVVRSVGTAGMPGYAANYLTNPADVAVTAEGHTWIVMNPAIVEYDETGAYVRKLPNETTPVPGTNSTHFKNPTGIAMGPDGRLYVADTGNHRVQIYTLGGTLPVIAATLGVTGVPGADDTHFNFPAKVIVHASGIVLVADTGNHRIQACEYVEETGWTCQTMLGETGVPGTDLGHLNAPQGIGVRGDDVYIADTGNARIIYCQMYIPAMNCRVFAGVTGMPGSDNAHFATPVDAAVGVDGRVYVSDQLNQRVQIFDAEGRYKATLGTTGVPYLSTDTYFNQPEGGAVSADGFTYVLENNGRRLVQLNAGGAITWQFGTAGTYGADPALLGSADGGPQGKPAVGSDGRVYFADSTRQRVLLVKPGTSEFWQAGVTDEAGTDQAHFNTPAGVALNPLNGDVFVLDRGNRRIQILSPDLAYKGTLATASLCGAEMTNCKPWDVAVDRAGILFVADAGNYRVQRCVPSADSYQCAIFAGTTGSAGITFDQLTPVGVAVDTQGRVYAVDKGAAPRVQVYNATGAYLTTLGGVNSSLNTGFNIPVSVALDSQGGVVVTDQRNMRLQVFTPGFPGWRQSNLNGFGSPAAKILSTLAVLDEALYAGVWGSPAQVWRTTDGHHWSKVSPAWTASALGGSAVFNEQLYLGVYNSAKHGEVWRTADGVTWQRVVESGFGDPLVVWVNELEAFDGMLYAVTEDSDTRMQVWRSPTGEAGSWVRVGAETFTTDQVLSEKVLEVFDGKLYLGRTRANLAELWVSEDGAAWTQVSIPGLAAGNDGVSALAEFDGSLYIGFRNLLGGEVWRTSNGTAFEQVAAEGLGSPANTRPYGLQVFQGELYLSFGNEVQGAELFKSGDGEKWEKVMAHGWGDWNNTYASYFDKSIVVFHDVLYLGTVNNANGAEVWRTFDLSNRIFAPLLIK